LILVFISFIFEICFGFFFFFFRSTLFLCLLPSLFQAGRFVMGLSSSPLFRVADRAALQCAEGSGGSMVALLADGVDGADGSVVMLLDGLHPCRW
jgi:hypothetical protein